MNRIASFESLLFLAQNIVDIKSYDSFVRDVLLLGPHNTAANSYQTKLDVYQVQTLLTVAGAELAHAESEKIREDFECRIRELERKLA